MSASATTITTAELDAHLNKVATPAQQRLAEWETKVAILDKWERDEIAHCSKEIHNLLFKFHASAALAIVKATLEIAIQEGQ